MHRNSVLLSVVAAMLTSIAALLGKSVITPESGNAFRSNASSLPDWNESS